MTEDYKAQQHRELAKKMKEDGRLADLGPDALQTLRLVIQGKKSLTEKEVKARKTDREAEAL